MSDDKVQVPDPKATYLATLYGKALDAGVAHPILGDALAAEAVARIDLDFTTLKVPNGGEITLPMRAWHFDQWTREFLAAHPDATVLHLGCGLDTRVYRLDPGPGVRWFDVDLPEVIALRRKLYPERDGYRLIEASVTDLSWLDEVPGGTPVCAVGEGLVMYLSEADGTALFRRITAQFSSGQLAFDAYSAAMVWLVSRLATVRGAKVELVWGVKDPHDLERSVPGLRLVDDVEFLVMPELVGRLSQISSSRRVMYALTNRLPCYRNLVHHLRYAF